MVLIAFIALAPSPLHKIEAETKTSKTAAVAPISAVKTNPEPILPTPLVAAAAIPAPEAPAPTCASEIAQYNWPQNVASAISQAESSLDPTRRGDGHLTYYQDGLRYGDSWGCFQIRYLPGRPTPDELVNPVTNVAYAYKLYMANAWNDWSVWHNGKYKLYL